MKHTIALDLGGTIIKIGLMKNGYLVDRTELEAVSSSGLTSQLVQIKKQVDRLIVDNNLTLSEVAGIGFSFAGLVDSVKHKIISTNQKYEDGPEVNLLDWALNNWNLPLFLENDARMALLGEYKYGVGRNYDDIVMVTLGTGVGAAALIEGHLLKGKHFQAGVLAGHFIINHNGATGTFKNMGSVEAEASTWRLPSLIMKHPEYNNSSISKEPVLDFKSLFKHVATDDSVSKEVLKHCLSAWSAGIVSMIHAFDPEIVILGGGIMKSAGLILPALEESIRQRAWTPWGKVKLMAAQHPDSAALYGADYLVNLQLNNHPVGSLK